MPNPTYRMVCGHDTGHAEVVLIEFDPKTVRYEDLVERFFAMHEPSHWSPGDQYRSAIFAFDDVQKETAEEVRGRLRMQGERIRTEIAPASTFWMAEEYHQQYYEKRGLGRPTATGCLIASPR